jgi:GGDEF domain-containing protein
MISIRRYMQDRKSPVCASGDSGTEPKPSMGFFHLYSRLLEHLSRCLVTNGGSSQFQPQLAELQAALHPDPSEDEAKRFDESARAIVAGHDRVTRESLMNMAIQMQHVVGVLGQALEALSGGTDRSVSRLQKIQETLHRTSCIQDVSTLRASLSDAVQFIRNESFRECQESARERENFESEAARIREMVAGNPNRRLPGRNEAVREVQDLRSTDMPGKATFVIVFVFEQLKAIVHRYGPEAVDDLFLLLIRERLQPIAPENTAYRWSASSLVAILQRAPDVSRLKAEMAAANREPLVHRIALGSRTATLKVGLSHLVLPANDASPDFLVGEIDRFTNVDAKVTA